MIDREEAIAALGALVTEAEPPHGYQSAYVAGGVMQIHSAGYPTEDELEEAIDALLGLDCPLLFLTYCRGLGA